MYVFRRNPSDSYKVSKSFVTNNTQMEDHAKNKSIINIVTDLANTKAYFVN